MKRINNCRFEILVNFGLFDKSPTLLCACPVLADGQESSSIHSAQNGHGVWWRKEGSGKIGKRERDIP